MGSNNTVRLYCETRASNIRSIAREEKMLYQQDVGFTPSPKYNGMISLVLVSRERDGSYRRVFRPFGCGKTFRNNM